MIRLYIDKMQKPLWSADYGDISTEVHLEEVFIDASGCTNSDLSADNINNPKVWLEFYDAELRVEENIGYIERVC